MAVQLPEGTSIQATVSQVARVESAARALGATGIYARVGKATDEEILAGADPGSSATAQLIVPVPASADAAKFAQQLRAKLPDLAKGALAIDLAGQSEFGSLIGREGRLVRVELSAPTLVESQRWADTVRTAMQTVPSLTDVRDAFAATQPIVEVSLERARMAERNIVPQQVASALAGALGGVSASELRETDRRTPIMVRYAGLRNEELETALKTPLRGVPLAQLVQVRETRAPLEVVRVGQRPVTIIVPYPAGGPSDFVARKIQPDAAAKLHQTMIIDNIGGAGGAIGMAKLVNAAADGHTLALASPMELVLAPMAIQGVKYKSEDFKLVAQINTTNTILTVRNSLNIKTVEELLAESYSKGGGTVSRVLAVKIQFKWLMLKRTR